LTGRIKHQVGGPTPQLVGDGQIALIGSTGFQTYQIARRSEESANGGVAKGFPKFFHDLLADGSTLKSLVGRIKRRETDEGTGFGNEDLVLGQVGGGSVVFAMCDTP